MPKAMPGPTLQLTDAPDAESMGVITKGLGDFNTETTGINDRRLLAVIVKDEAGKTLGGVLGRTYLGLMFLDTFYLPKSERGARQPGAGDGRGRGAAARLQVGGALYDQLPGPGILQTPRLAGLWPDSVRSAGHQPHLPDQGAVATGPSVRCRLQPRPSIVWSSGCSSTRTRWRASRGLPV